MDFNFFDKVRESTEILPEVYMYKYALSHSEVGIINRSIFTSTSVRKYTIGVNIVRCNRPSPVICFDLSTTYENNRGSIFVIELNMLELLSNQFDNARPNSAHNSIAYNFTIDNVEPIYKFQIDITVAQAKQLIYEWANNYELKSVKF